MNSLGSLAAYGRFAASLNGGCVDARFGLMVFIPFTNSPRCLVPFLEVTWKQRVNLTFLWKSPIAPPCRHGVGPTEPRSLIVSGIYKPTHQHPWCAACTSYTLLERISLDLRNKKSQPKRADLSKYHRKQSVSVRGPNRVVDLRLIQYLSSSSSNFTRCMRLKPRIAVFM